MKGRKGWNIDVTSPEYREKQAKRRSVIVNALSLINLVIATVALIKAYQLF